MPATVYSITHRATGREYIGVTSRPVEQRWREHLADARVGRGSFLHRAIRKHGSEDFDFRVRASLPTIEEAWLAERILVAFENPAFNLTNGGEGTPGWSHTESTRAKISAALKASDALKAANRAAGLRKRGRKLSEAHRQALKQAHVGFTGRTHSPEARAKLSARSISPETRQRMSEAAAKREAARRLRCR